MQRLLACGRQRLERLQLLARRTLTSTRLLGCGCISPGPRPELSTVFELTLLTHLVLSPHRSSSARLSSAPLRIPPPLPAPSCPRPPPRTPPPVRPSFNLPFVTPERDRVPSGPCPSLKLPTLITPSRSFTVQDPPALLTIPPITPNAQRSTASHLPHSPSSPNASICRQPLRRFLLLNQFILRRHLI